MTRLDGRIHIALFTSLLTVSATAVAQTAPPPPPPAQPSQPATTAPATTPPTQTAPATTPPAQTAPATAPTSFSDEQIRKFASAWLQIRSVHEQYKPQLDAAPAEQKPALEQEANARMTAIVEAQGLEPETFNAISTAADQDEQLRARIGQEVAKVEGAGAAR